MNTADVEKVRDDIGAVLLQVASEAIMIHTGGGKRPGYNVIIPLATDKILAALTAPADGCEQCGGLETVPVNDGHGGTAPCPGCTPTTEGE